MKFIKQIATVAILGTLVSCNENQKADVKTLDSSVDSVSYAIGVNMAKQFKQGFDEVDYDLFLQGFRNGKDSTNILIEDKDLQLTINTYFQKKQAEQRKEQQAEGLKNKKAGEDFLAENKEKDGVMTTESGLQYMVMKEGNGKKPKADSMVKIHYHGTTISGDVFDSTVDKGKPYEAKANQFVPGFSEGLLLMKEGAKYKFFIPQELAYKQAARSAQIKPYSALVFEVEMLEVN